jgi:hypothetical protein
MVRLTQGWLANDGFVTEKAWNSYPHSPMQLEMFSTRMFAADASQPEHSSVGVRNGA